MCFGDVECLVDGRVAKRAAQVCMLGDQVAVENHERLEVLLPEQRVRECEVRVARIGCLPGTRESRLQVVASMALPTLYGGEFATVPMRRLYALRRRVWQAVRGDHRPMNEFALELAFAIFAPGHRTDPVQAIDYQRVMLVAG